MAYEGAIRSIPGAVTGANQSANQFKFQITNSSGQSILNTAAGGVVDGVLQDNPSVVGEAANVAFSGVSKVEAGGTVASGALVQSGAAGTALLAATGDYHCGRCIEGGAIGELITVLLDVRGNIA